jgi:aminoglycoside 3-N-acetyltransferase
MSQSIVTSDQIASELRRLGIQPGDLIQVHSSLSAFGWVEGGADAVVDALLAAVGPGGTVMVPTFNHGRVKLYDPKKTPSNNGAITEALRRRPHAHRSLHPTHPYAAIGPRAAELTAGHLEVDTFSRLSPLGKLADRGGWIVLLGVDMTSNTCVHIGQTIARAHCLGLGAARSLMRIDGQMREVPSTLWRNGRCKIEFDPVEDYMQKRGQIRTGRVGNAGIRIMRGRDVIDTTLHLCARFCPDCPAQPDWDAPEAVRPDPGPLPMP